MISSHCVELSTRACRVLCRFFCFCFLGQKVADFVYLFFFFGVLLPLRCGTSSCLVELSCGTISQVLNELNRNRIRFCARLYAGFVCTLAKCNWKIGKKKGLRRLRGLSAQGSAENVREKPTGKFICHPSRKGCSGGRARARDKGHGEEM